MMTKQRALLRARMLLGKNANVSMGKSHGKNANGEHFDTYKVGVIEGLAGMGFFVVRGVGESWEEALDNADRYVRGVSLTFLSEELSDLLSALAMLSRGPVADGPLPELGARIVSALRHARERDARAG